MKKTTKKTTKKKSAVKAGAAQYVYGIFLTGGGLRSASYPHTYRTVAAAKASLTKTAPTASYDILRRRARGHWQTRPIDTYIYTPTPIRSY
jgi:hypothetical protein